MCGIAGIWRPGGWRVDEAAALGRAMTGPIRHRGPDAGAHWADVEAGILLGHRRLAILDLSGAGAQPMHSPSGRSVIVFNGEIYNHLDMRRRLEAEGAAPAWRGHSDTETLLAGIEAWGVAPALEGATGMFAFALWDRRDRRLVLARDRMGEKPLYWGRAGGALVFGSELKALRAVPGFEPALDPAAVAGFLRHGYVPEPASIYRGIAKLPPGTALTLAHPGDEGAPASYWALEAALAEGARGPLEADPAALADAVEEALGAVVASQMQSDVPLGCFLSGGIDSSLVASLMQRAASAPVRTFSIGFRSARLDEAGHARAVAAHLGTAHTELTVTEEDALAVVPDLPAIYDEPFADSSQIPTTLLCRLARQEVTVALTGDGGDEVFGGYNRHVSVPALWRALGSLPGPVRQGLGRAMASPLAARLGRVPALDRAGRAMGLPLTALDKIGHVGGALARAGDYGDFYRGIAGILHDPAALLRPELRPGATVDPDREHEHDLADVIQANRPGRWVEWTMAMDTLTYLPGDILVKVDRAAMSASLETRCPLLDRRVVELAWRLPLAAKVRGGRGKRILREILARHVPPALVGRPKQGFAIPLADWLRGALRPWAEAQLAPARIEAAGVLEASAVRALWDGLLAGRSTSGAEIWTLLMLQSWLEAPAAEAGPPLAVARFA